MKKLLALLLVLGMASMANAALTWSAEEITIDLTVADSAVVQIISDSDVSYDPVWAGNDENAFANIVAIAPLTGAGPDATVDDPTVSGYPGWWLIAGADKTGTPNDEIFAGPQFDVTIQGLVEGQAMLSADAYGGTGPDDILTVNVIPEPLTLSLLGLGGLALLRRRR